MAPAGKRPPGLAQLVAGGEQRDPQRRGDGEAGPADGGGEPDILRPQPESRREDRAAGLHVLAGLAAVAAALDARDG